MLILQPIISVVRNVDSGLRKVFIKRVRPSIYLRVVS
jgi:hypothetical protein